MSPASTWLVLHRTPRGWIRRRRAHKGPLRYRVVEQLKSGSRARKGTRWASRRPTNGCSSSAVVRLHRTTALGLIGDVKRRVLATASVALDHDFDVNGVHVLHDHRPVAEVKAGEVVWAVWPGR